MAARRDVKIPGHSPPTKVSSLHTQQKEKTASPQV